MIISATELKELIGHTIDMAKKEPVIITKTNKPVVVMISLQEYNRLIAMEEIYKKQLFGTN